MPRTRVELLSPGMAELLNDPKLGPVLEAALRPAEAAARAAAPVETGAYRDSIHIEIVHTDRVVARLIAGTDHATFVESKLGILAKSLNAAGGSA